MKLRIGFVTNSSSTSFTVIGTCLGEYENISDELKKKILRHIATQCSEDGKFNKALYDEYYTDDNYEFVEGLEALYVKHGAGILDTIEHYTYYPLVLGIHPNELFDDFSDKTCAEVKEMLKKEIDDFFGVDSKIRFIYDSWMDN